MSDARLRRSLTEPVIETREVLAAAYLGKRPRRLQTHAVLAKGPNDLFDPVSRRAIRVLCTRVRLENLADRGASDPHAPVTCRACQAALRKRGVHTKEQS